CWRALSTWPSPSNSSKRAPRTAWSGWRRSRARRNRASIAYGWACRSREWRRWSWWTISARPRCCAFPTWSAIRSSTPAPSASPRPRGLMSLGNEPQGKDLFGKALPAAPLAEKLRPRSLDEIVGQKHLLGPGKPLRIAFESGQPHSMILWGPPGSGKTTLARLMAIAFEAEFIALSAVLSGVKDIRDAVQAAERSLAEHGRRTILFVD